MSEENKTTEQETANKDAEQKQEDVKKETDKKETGKKEMPVKQRHIIGAIIMIIGVLLTLLVDKFAGVMILVAGMWAYNPEVDPDGNQKTISTWLGTLIIIASIVALVWVYNYFIL